LWAQQRGGGILQVSGQTYRCSYILVVSVSAPIQDLNAAPPARDSPFFLGFFCVNCYRPADSSRLVACVDNGGRKKKSNYPADHTHLPIFKPSQKPHPLSIHPSIHPSIHALLLLLLLLLMDSRYGFFNTGFLRVHHMAMDA